VLVANDLGIVSHISDEVLVMHEGRVVERGKTCGSSPIPSTTSPAASFRTTTTNTAADPRRVSCARHKKTRPDVSSVAGDCAQKVIASLVVGTGEW
jgi:ABC-type dipeptide/oligopeptide/nickel transport system ATPase component